MIGWLTHLQHTRGKHVWFLGILDERLDDFNHKVFQPQIDGSKTGLDLLAHRDELTAQNRAKFQRVVPGVATSVIDATEKSWGGQVAFEMVTTLARASNLADTPRLDLLVVDEAHHALADSYRRIIHRVREAIPTPASSRSRRRRTGATGRACARFSTSTRACRTSCGGSARPVSDFDMAEVAGIMDRAPVTDEVIRHWEERGP